MKKFVSLLLALMMALSLVACGSKADPTTDDKTDDDTVTEPANALEKIIGYGVKQIVYISCNPKSLADNLYYMQYYGYEIKSVKPFDNFPGTKHTECVAVLEKVEK